jgi:hypothetical protein
MLRAGVVGALVVGILGAVPAPAFAEDPDVQITNLSSGTLNAGQQATLQYSVQNNNETPTSFQIRVNTFDGLTCNGDCDVQRLIPPGQTQNFNATLVGGSVPAGQTKQGTLRIRAESNNGSSDASRNMTVRGPEQQQEQSVKQVSGKVKDTTTGEGIEGAAVAMLDSKGHNCNTTTTSSGNYRFTSCEGEPIAVGEIFVGAQHEDYGQVEEKKVVGAAGQSVVVGTFALKSSKAATPSAQPSAPATEAAEPTGEATPEATNLNANNASDSSSGGMGSWLLIIVGGLLVALGVGAIVLLIVRRKQDNGDPGIDDDQPLRPGGRTPVPGAAGVYHPANDMTRMAGAGAGAAPTMVGRPSIADAPTMLHSPVPPADEFPDPYGAPLPPQSPSYNGQGAGGYGPGGAGATSVYGAASGPSNGYGGPGGGANGAGTYGRGPAGGAGEYGRPTSGSGYGGPSGPTSGSGYGGPNGAPAGGEYGRPTSGSGYGPPSGQGGYDRGGANGYGGPAAPGGYGSPAAPAGPYAGGGGRGGDDGYSGGRDYREPQAGGYGAPPAGGGAYGGGDRYDEPTGRWEGGDKSGGPGGAYGQPKPPAYESGPYGGGGAGGYRPEPEPDRGGGYAPGGGYEQGGYGPAEGGYGRPAGGAGGAGGYDQGGAYGGGQGGGGYGGNGYDQQGGYDPRGGYDQVPQQRGGTGYDPRGGGYDEQGAYYDDQAGPRSGRGGPQQPAARSERRSLDWLDD